MLATQDRPAPYIKFPEKLVAIDTETTGLYVYKGDVPFAWSAVFPDGTELFGRDDFDKLKEICEDPTIDKIFFNAKFDWRMIEKKGIKVLGKIWDVGILCHLMDGRDASGHLNLDDQSQKYLPAEYRKVVAEIEKWFNENGYGHLKKKERYAHFDKLPNEILRSRVVGDARLTLMLFMRLFNTVAKHFAFLLDQETRLIPVVKHMEDRGVLVDPVEIQTQMDHFQSVVDDVIRFCEDMLGTDEGFNINSPVHQAELLKTAGIYEQITEFTKPKKGRKSTKAFVPKRKLDGYNLQMLHHPVAWMLLVGKAANKMISPFLTQALEFMDADGILHPSYKQTGTTSGRFSCSEPNLQNIPTEGDRRASYTEDEAAEALDMTGHNFAPHIKRIFKVREGRCHVHADKKQAEMVALCQYTRDEKMREIFLSGESIHDGICMALFNEITKGLKQRSKAVTFGYQFGASVKVMARKAGVSTAEGYALKARYKRIFPSLDAWRAVLEEMVRARGYVETMHGRRHYLFRNEAYMAVNRMCQGTIGDEIKSRMIALYEWIMSEGLDAFLVLNIHDDLAVDMALEERHRIPELHEIMEETAMPWYVPLPSSVDITYTRWSDLKTLKTPQDTRSYPSPEGLPEIRHADVRPRRTILLPEPIKATDVQTATSGEMSALGIK